MTLASQAGSDVLFVNVDSDSISCGAFRPGILSDGKIREKFVKILERAIDKPTHTTNVPREFQESFPQGRFRPLSKVEASGRVTNAERLLPPTTWTYDQDKIMQAFDQVLSTEQTRGWAKVLFKTSRRKQYSETKSQAQAIMRDHTNAFIDKRDLLEARIWRLNRRLATLMSESDQWKSSIDTFKRFASKQDVESRDLRVKLQKERSEARRREFCNFEFRHEMSMWANEIGRPVSGVVSVQKEAHSQLQSVKNHVFRCMQNT